jgi:mycothiol synthase
VLGEVSAAAADEVLRLAAAAAAADGAAPLSEQVLLHLRYGGAAAARNLLLYQAGNLAGYAHLDPPGPAASRGGELVIHPASRRHGLGLALARALLAAGDGTEVWIWAHGDLPAARRLAAVSGFTRARALWQMRRPLAGPLPEPARPAGVTFRTFAPGQDEEAWLSLNARAFASHPEQGGWTRADLDHREREPWFDPAGFFLAERGGRLAGFHWTKVHAAGADRAAGSGADAARAGAARASAVGEVYVVGVDPDERGTGLGRTLTLAGLRYLRERGLPEVMLYVDESNTAAIRLYESLGFAHTSTDVMFRHPGDAGGEVSSPGAGRAPHRVPRG